jgi:hypothetical protein
MSRDSAKSNRAFRGVWQWVKEQITQDVPNDVALCEFDCRKQQCTAKEWETCERRISKAVGELSPPMSHQLLGASGDTRIPGRP